MTPSDDQEADTDGPDGYKEPSDKAGLAGHGWECLGVAGPAGIEGEAAVPTGASPDFWPAEPPRLTVPELEEFVGDMAAGRLFVSADLPSYEKGGAAFTDEFASAWPFWELVLEAYGAPPKSYTPAIGVFWSYRSDAQGFNEAGRPTFIQTPKALHRYDWLVVREAIQQAREIERSRERNK